MRTLQNNIVQNIIFKNISRTRPPLSRIGIVGGWDLRNTGNVQRVVNNVPNGSFLVRESGVTPTQTGWLFGGINNYVFAEVPAPVPLILRI